MRSRRDTYQGRRSRVHAEVLARKAPFTVGDAPYAERQRRCHGVTEGSEEIRMRKIAAHLFGYAGEKKRREAQ